MKSDAMNAHKAMAGAGNTGNFGVTKMPGREAPHPDVNMKHEPMADSMRSAAHRGMQGAPDHGSLGNDHFVRGGKV